MLSSNLSSITQNSQAAGEGVTDNALHKIYMLSVEVHMLP